jgi:hypothetical protein
MGRGRRDRIRGHAERDPSPRISLSAAARQYAKFREHYTRNLERTRVQHYRSGRAELQIRLGWILGLLGLIEKESSTPTVGPVATNPWANEEKLASLCTLTAIACLFHFLLAKKEANVFVWTSVRFHDVNARKVGRIEVDSTTVQTVH